MQLIQVVSIVVLAGFQAFAFPTGAPKCRITEQVIQKGHKVAQSNLGLTMSVPASYTPGGPAIPITVNGNFPATAGVLAYVTPGTTQDSTLTAANGPTGGAPQHVGAFTNLAAQGLRAQTAASCATLNVQNDAPESTITHSVPMLGLTTMTVMWTPPAQNYGPVTVNMVIAGNANQPWQIVPSLQIASDAGTTGLVTAAAPAPAPAGKKGKKGGKKAGGALSDAATNIQDAIQGTAATLGNPGAIVGGILSGIGRIAGGGAN
ncbi:hypothetical protein BDR26DRAFT_914013 [Obelidium mucronatum]|nr:hypothetical protein BDR26DRAFT_914013 [Obelidium mucronatum]